MAKTPSLREQLLEIIIALNQSVKRGNLNVDRIENGEYSSDRVDVDDYYLSNAVAIVDLDLFDDLSSHACKYLLNVIKNMKRNNMFYRIGTTTANERRSLAELKRYKILVATEKKGLYIINPFKLRRGKPLATAWASIFHYGKDNDVLILEDLYPPRKATSEVRLLPAMEQIRSFGE